MDIKKILFWTLGGMALAWGVVILTLLRFWMGCHPLDWSGSCSPTAIFG